MVMQYYGYIKYLQIIYIFKMLNSARKLIVLYYFKINVDLLWEQTIGKHYEGFQDILNI